MEKELTRHQKYYRDNPEEYDRVRAKKLGIPIEQLPPRRSYRNQTKVLERIDKAVAKKKQLIDENRKKSYVVKPKKYVTDEERYKALLDYQKKYRAKKKLQKSKEMTKNEK